MKKVSNIKINYHLAIDWLKDFWLLVVLCIGALFVTIFPVLYLYLSYLVFAVALFITAWFFYWAIRAIIINHRVSCLNEKKRAEYNRLLREFKKRKVANRRKMEYNWLRGLPITLHDKDGTIRIIQSGQTDVVMSTMN